MQFSTLLFQCDAGYAESVAGYWLEGQLACAVDVLDIASLSPGPFVFAQSKLLLVMTLDSYAEDLATAANEKFSRTVVHDLMCANSARPLSSERALLKAFKVDPA